MTYTDNRPVKMTLAHINDTHSYFEPTSLPLTIQVENSTLTPYVSAGGFARIATRIKQLRKQAQDEQRGFVFLHAGDCFQGTLYFSLFKGKANSDMLNALGIDAMTLGNHELDMGNQPVAQFAKRIEFPLLAGNWDLSHELKSKKDRLSDNESVLSYDVTNNCANWMVKQVEGEPIAIFGLSLDKMDEISNPDSDTPFIDALQTAENTIREIQKTGINKIILLSHLGYEVDLELAKQVSGISVIVGGHSHRLQGDFSDLGLEKDDPYGIRIGDTYVVQAGYYALSLGHAEIEFSADGVVTAFSGKNELLLGRRLFLDASMSETGEDLHHRQACDFIHQHPNVVVCKKDPDVHALLADKYIPRVRKLQSEVIAVCDQPLKHVRVPDENGASQVAPLVAEAFVHALNQRGHEVEFAIHNAGGVRTSIREGEMSVADVAGKLLPFAVPIGRYDVKGEVIAAVLEGAINNATNNDVVGTGTGSYPYTYNLKFRYDGKAKLGERILDLQIFTLEHGWQAIENKKVYRGTSSAYTMKGKEGYEAILNMEDEGWVSGLSMADCFIELLQARPDLLTKQHLKQNQR
ncbi:5'-nucleotidase [Vibrio xiamenensis]|uniref:5'-nucleotidase n=1 Tax=Vibrio xiamenensis TaxID=861298 RepID=A0A1G7YUI9_9VIBR|nr:bifunctional metallophosphatase/5'-nucleotidase [Vibrio xiamenensis]SDH00183.1 5'-nucleotidase [Vibrio xiamenensis]